MMGPLKAFLNRLVLATGKPQEPFRKECVKAQYKPGRLKPKQTSPRAVVFNLCSPLFCRIVFNFEHSYCNILVMAGAATPN